MPRPKKRRRVGFLPEVTVFQPVGASRADGEEIVLTVEELEAIRLKDVEDLDQTECAQRMQVSRPTFQRILDSARAKVASALTRGLALRVAGGTFDFAQSGWCPHCRREVVLRATVPDADAAGGEPMCPACGGPLTQPEGASPPLSGDPPGARHCGRRRRCRRSGGPSGAGSDPEPGGKQ